LRTKIMTVGLGLLTATVVACGSGGGDTAGPGAQGDDATGEKTIVLEVTGAGAADITYGLGVDQSQEQGAKLPWRKTLTSSEALIIPTVVAQNKGAGTISCKITVDGKLEKENRSSGEFAVVTCSTG
jgi:hypothetical protein